MYRYGRIVIVVIAIVLAGGLTLSATSYPSTAGRQVFCVISCGSRSGVS